MSATMRTTSTLILLVALAGAWRDAAAASERFSDEQQRELALRGMNAFDEAMDAMRTDHAQAEESYRRAAAAFESLIDDGVNNAALHYNLGNAYFRLGELGKAVLHYRRGLRLEPHDPDLLANLEYARNRVEPFIKPSGQQQLIERLTAWMHRFPPHWHVRSAAVCALLGWGGLALWLRRRGAGLATLSCLAIALSLTIAGATLWQWRDQSLRPHAVIVKDEQTLRLGRGEGYDPALTQLLGAGVELRVLSERADWAEVQLADGTTGWLPCRALEKL